MAPKSAKRAGSLEYGKSGEATLVKLDDNRARFDFSDGESVTLQVKLGNVFEDDNATLPEYVPFKVMKPNGALKVRCSFEKGEKKVLFINPLSGEQKVKFVRFQSPEGSEPVWTEKPGKKGKPYREANPFFEIVDGRWKGCIIRGRLFDNFGLWEEDGMTTVFGEGTGSQNLRDFCDCVGFPYYEVPFNENHLPEIQKLALSNDNEFSIVLVSGYISNYVPGLDDDAFGDAMAESNKADAAVNELLKD